MFTRVILDNGGYMHIGSLGYKTTVLYQSIIGTQFV
jgi:hypothetical protein